MFIQRVATLAAAAVLGTALFAGGGQAATCPTPTPTDARYWEVTPDPGTGTAECVFHTDAHSPGLHSPGDPIVAATGLTPLTGYKTDVPGTSDVGSDFVITVTDDPNDPRAGTYFIRSAFSTVWLGFQDGSGANSTALFKLTGTTVTDNSNFIYSGLWAFLAPDGVAMRGALSNAAVYIPLPASALLLFGGLAGLGFASRRRRKATA